MEEGIAVRDPRRGPAQGWVRMDHSEAARGARRDQAHAAQSDVVDILLTVARGRQRWSRIDDDAQATIEALLGHLFADDTDATWVCPHASNDSFDRAPQPLVLDAVHGILACWNGCYWHRLRSESPGGPLHATCFDCARALTGIAGHDLFIAYGPLLVVGALCPQCRDGSDPAPPPRDRAR